LTDLLFKWQDHLIPIYEEGENLQKHEDEVSSACRGASSCNKDACPSYGRGDAFLYQVDSVHFFDRRHVLNAFNYSFKGHRSYLKMLALTLAHSIYFHLIFYFSCHSMVFIYRI
jgi:hypothetical protein